MKPSKITFLIPHKKDCIAVNQVKNGIWKYPWGVCEGVFRNKSGAQKGLYYWLKITCNDSDCPAEKLIPFTIIATIGDEQSTPTKPEERGT